MAIGIFGGAFDPVHNAHVRIVEAALGQADLSRVVVVPNAFPPHRNHPSAPIGDRLEMARLAMASVPGADVSDMEADVRKGPYFTVDTVGRIADRFPGENVVVVTGADSFATLDEWRHWRELVGMCGWLVAPRTGFDFPVNVPMVVMEEFGSGPVSVSAVGRQPGTVALLGINSEDEASTDIRNAFREDGCCSVVPENVAKYIREHELYR